MNFLVFIFAGLCYFYEAGRSNSLEVKTQKFSQPLQNSAGFLQSPFLQVISQCEIFVVPASS